MDFDGDGILDMLSGSYDPGGIYWFRGLGNGTFAKVAKLRDRDGVPLVHHPTALAGSKSRDESLDASSAFGSWPAAIDWDGDNDFDLLIGSFHGEVWLRNNEGDRNNPLFHPDSVRVQAINGPIKVDGQAHPVTVDWDRDGLWDLVIGSADGSVGWHRNIGDGKAPRFSPYKVLVPAASQTKNLKQILLPGDQPRPGVRAQICVADYDLDGWADLLVGDYSEIKWQRALDDSAEKEYQANLARMNEAQEVINKLGYDGKEVALLQEKMEELRRLIEVDKQFFHETRSASFVWLYLRNPPGNSDDANDETDDGNFGPALERMPLHNQIPIGSSPVAVSTELVPSPDQEGELVLVVNLKIENGWHLYASRPAEVAGQNLEMDLELPEEIIATGDWQCSPAVLEINHPESQIYRRQVTWKRTLKKLENESDKSDLKLTILFQACNESLCLPPTKVVKTLSISSDSEKESNLPSRGKVRNLEPIPKGV